MQLGDLAKRRRVVFLNARFLESVVALNCWFLENVLVGNIVDVVGMLVDEGAILQLLDFIVLKKNLLLRLIEKVIQFTNLVLLLLDLFAASLHFVFHEVHLAFKVFELMLRCLVLILRLVER